MKSLPTDLATHFAGKVTSIATALKIMRADAQVFGFTTNNVDDVVSGVTYVANPGLDVTALVIAANAAVGNLELTTLHDGTVFTTVDIFNGVWRNAAFMIFRYNWRSVADGIDTLLTGTIGQVEIKLNTVVAELRDLRQYLQQPVGSASSKTCRYRLGSTDKNNGGLCLKNLTAFTYTGTLTGVTSNRVFQDTGRAEAANWFDEGEIEFDDGPNAGIAAKVKSYAVNGTFTLMLPLYGTVAVGQAYTAIAGCRKRLAEDCSAKFSNVLNFGGEPHRQGLNDLTKNTTGSV